MKENGFFLLVVALFIACGILYVGHAASECDGTLVVKATGGYACLEDK